MKIFHKNKNRLKETKLNEQGFTLIEMVIVIMITGTVFIAIYALFAGTIRNDIESRYEVIASNLAQEGVEIVRNIRDENVLMAVNDPNVKLAENLIDGTCYPYLDSDGDPSCDVSNGKGELIQKTSGEVYENCPSGGCPDSDTDFRRACVIDIENDEEKFIVKCTVSWDSFANFDIEREISASSTLTNWQD